MKVVITGATGFIGRHLVTELKGIHEVLALTRQTILDSNLGVNCVRTDFSREELCQSLRGCHAVIHLAAQRSYHGADSSIIENGLLDFRLFQAAEECGVNHIVYASTRGIYGAQLPPWSEVTPPAPNSLYSLAKLHSEATAAFFVQRVLRITTLRLAQVFGLGEYEGSAITTFLRNAYQGNPIALTVTGIRREYLYVKDLARAIEKTLADPTSGTYNLGSGEVVSLEEVAHGILCAFGRQKGILTPENRKDMGEYSLMDSTRFRERFSWKPDHTFTEAADDVARMLQNKEIAKNYGLSVS